MVAARVALFLRDRSNDYQRLIEDDCVAAVRRRDTSLQVFTGVDHETQEQQIRAVLAQPPARRATLLMVCPVREMSLRLVAREAVAQGIGWVLLTRWSDYLVDLRAEFPQVPVFSISADQHEIGLIQGRQFKLILPGGGEIAYIRGPVGTSSAQRRFQAMQQEIAGTALNVVAFNGDWTSDGGARAMNEWLQLFQRGKNRRFVVGAQNDQMAIGARKALLEWADRAPGLIDLVDFTGCDGLPAGGQRLVSEGELTATVVVPAVAGQALDEASSMLQGGRSPAAEIVVHVSSHPELPQLERALRVRAPAK